VPRTAPALGWQNSQFSPQTITQSSISSLNYENSHFGPQTFAADSISSLNYENGHFGPQTFTYGSNSSLIDSQIPFYPSLIPTQCSLLANRSCRSSSPEMKQGPRASFVERAHKATTHPWPASAVPAPKIRTCRRKRRYRLCGFGGAVGRQTGGRPSRRRQRQ
jgi:hypothetical protein